MVTSFANSDASNIDMGQLFIMEALFIDSAIAVDTNLGVGSPKEVITSYPIWYAANAINFLIK